jgi:hypothetical protein
MKDGMLLMIDRALKISGPFEGILGLGIPKVPMQPGVAGVPTTPDASGPVSTPTGPEPPGAVGSLPKPGEGMPPEIEDILGHIISEASEAAGIAGITDIIGNMVGEGGIPGVVNTSSQPASRTGGPINTLLRKAIVKTEDNATENTTENTTIDDAENMRPPPLGFLEQSGDARFSMCFNRGRNGVLRIGATPATQVHGSCGTAHWGVAMEGISLGANSTDDVSSLVACKPEQLRKGQDSPCGAIPDSGTTLFMGPKAHVKSIMEGICDKWDRCRQNYTKFKEAEAMAAGAMVKNYGVNPYEDMTLGRHQVFQMLLADCGRWMTNEESLNELPPVHFHIVGTSGTKQVLKIPAKTYVMEMEAQSASTLGFSSDIIDTDGSGNESIPVNPSLGKAAHGKAGRAETVCRPAFGPMEYPTAKNGPVWILGTGLFYEYVVGYNMETTPPSMSFTSQSEQPCGSCASNARLAADEESTLWRPLMVTSKPRMPTLPRQGEL